MVKNYLNKKNILITGVTSGIGKTLTECLSSYGANIIMLSKNEAELDTMYDEIIKKDGVTFVIDPSAILFIIGSTIDWKEDKFKRGFSFENPNETARCGCGESFSV